MSVRIAKKALSKTKYQHVALKLIRAINAGDLDTSQQIVTEMLSSKKPSVRSRFAQGVKACVDCVFVGGGDIRAIIPGAPGKKCPTCNGKGFI